MCLIFFGLFSSNLNRDSWIVQTDYRQTRITSRFSKILVVLGPLTGLLSEVSTSLGISLILLSKDGPRNLTQPLFCRKYTVFLVVFFNIQTRNLLATNFQTDPYNMVHIIWVTEIFRSDFMKEIFKSLKSIQVVKMKYTTMIVGALTGVNGNVLQSVSQDTKRYNQLIKMMENYNPNFDDKKYWTYGCNCLMLGDRPMSDPGQFQKKNPTNF